MSSHKLEYLIIGIIGFVSICLVLVYDKLASFVGREGLWTMVIVFFAIVFFVLLRNLFNKNSDFFELINPFLVIFTLYTMMLPINYLISPKYFDPTILLQYLMISIVGLLGFIIGYYLTPAKKTASKLPVLRIENRVLVIGATVLFLIGLGSFAINVASFGGLKTYFTMGYGPSRYLLTQQQLTLGYGWDWIGLSSYLFLIVALRNKRRYFIIFLVFCIICWIILSFWLGYRRPIIYLLIIVFLSYNYLFHRVRVWPVLLSALMIYFILTAYGYTRSLLPKYGLSKVLSETVGFVFRRPDLVLPVATGEFTVVAESIIEIISSQSINLKFGESYLVGLLTVIPGMQRILPGELISLGSWRVITFYPGLEERGAGLAFHVLAEGLINFGVFGVFIHMFLYGFIAKIAYEYLRNDSRNPLVVIAYAVTAPIILFDAIRSDFTGSFFKWSHTYFGPVILALIFAHVITIVARRVKLKND